MSKAESCKAAKDSTRPRTNAQTAGDLAEALAAEYLIEQGLRIVTRNFRIKGGEIDLIAEDGRTIVFVEVRLRRNSAFGSAGESITVHKQRRIVLAARLYLARHPALYERACRFDCLLLDALSGNNIEWVRDAFSAD